MPSLLTVHQSTAVEIWDLAQWNYYIGGNCTNSIMLMGMGGCTAFDVVTILKKSRQDITSCEAVLDAERAEGVPAVFTKVHVHFIVKGNNLKDAQVKKAVDLSADKYCSASIMLGQAGVVITHDYEIAAD